MDLVMVDGVRRFPDRRAVAVLADIGRQNVGRAFAGRISAVLATEAIAGDIGMIEIGWRPGDGRMSVVTVVSARDMAGILPGRRHAIVAARA